MAVINRDEVLERLGGDGELYVEICGLFRRDGQMLLDRLRSSLADSDLDGARRAVHAITSLAVNVGAEGLHHLACRVEQAGRAGDVAAVEGYLPQLERQLHAVLKQLPTTA